MPVLSALAPRLLTDFRLCFASKGVLYGEVGMHTAERASALALAIFGNFLGPVFHRYADGYRFPNSRVTLSKARFIATRAKSYDGNGA